MANEAVKKLQNFEEVSAGDLNKVLSMVPVTENVSGLMTGDTIKLIKAITAGYVTIRGQKSTNPVVVLVCDVAGEDGVTKERPIYLSSFIRKHDINGGSYTGMLLSDAAFAGKTGDFDNKAWYETLKAVGPFYVKNVDVQERTINRNGVPTKINSRQIEFVKGANPKMVGAVVDPTAKMTGPKRAEYNTANGTTWDGKGNQS